MEEQEVVESVEPVEPAEGQTPEVTQEVPAEAAAEGAETPEAVEAVEGEQGQPPVPQYVPNYAYKAVNQDREFPEWVRPLIVNKEAEEVFKDIFTKYDAFDFMKEKSEAISQRYSELNEQVTREYLPVIEDLRSAHRALQNKDLGKVFEILGIDERLALGWAVDKAKYQEMTPEEKHAYDARIKMMRDNEDLRTRNETLNSSHRELQIAQRTRELDYVLQRPEVNQVMQQYDQARGQVGAFRNEVIAYAAGRYNVNGEDIPADKAVESVLSLMGFKPGGASQPTQRQTQQVVPPQAKPVLPNFKSGHSSVVSKRAQSIDDLRKIAESL